MMSEREGHTDPGRRLDRGWTRHACLAVLMILPMAVMLAILDFLAWEPVLDSKLFALIVSCVAALVMAAIAIRIDKLRGAGALAQAPSTRALADRGARLVAGDIPFEITQRVSLQANSPK